MVETKNDPEKDAESQAAGPLSEELLNEVSGGDAANGYSDFNFTLN